MIKQVMEAARVSDSAACPRGLRHAFGVGTLQAGVPLNLTKRWLGHARISTTAIYAAACGPEEQAMAARFWRANDQTATQQLLFSATSRSSAEESACTGEAGRPLTSASGSTP